MTAMRNWKTELGAMCESAAGRERLIAESFARVTGGELLPAEADATTALWLLPAAVVAHGTEADPVFFYANRTALELFDVQAVDFVRMPSRLSAEAVEREERARLMARVTRENFIDDYSGIRVSASGKRFRIDSATVWNLIDAGGVLMGQAATFDRWTDLS